MLGSTGKIMYDLNKVILANDNNSYMGCAYSESLDENIYSTNFNGYYYALRKNILISRITGKMGYRYKKSTDLLLKWMDKCKPDIIHLHNIHGDWINIRLLFEYIKACSVPVVWTLHDCWPFTGRCSHFELCRCMKWTTGCYDCNNLKVYPISYFFDYSKEMWADKKELFTDIPNMIIVTPSYWLANYVKQSFLNIYPIITIHNGIDLDVYKPSSVKSQYLNGNTDKKIILGVANSWSQTKGLDDFLQLNKAIDHNVYKIVLVGLNKRQLNSIPDSIIGIGRTNNQTELVELYSSANVFVNPTYQDNYPTTNLEAIACGTPVITYNTGGSPESVKGNGCVVKKGDLRALIQAINKICEKQKDSISLRNHAKFNFDKNITFKNYIKLYNDIIAKN